MSTCHAELLLWDAGSWHKDRTGTAAAISLPFSPASLCWRDFKTTLTIPVNDAARPTLIVITGTDKGAFLQGHRAERHERKRLCCCVFLRPSLKSATHSPALIQSPRRFSSLALFLHFSISNSTFHFLCSCSALLRSEAAAQWLLDPLSILFACLSFHLLSFRFSISCIWCLSFISFCLFSPASPPRPAFFFFHYIVLFSALFWSLFSVLCIRASCTVLPMFHRSCGFVTPHSECDKFKGS